MRNNLRYIDLFAGIGGFRLGMTQAGFTCVYSCEKNEHACAVYKANFGEDPTGDITVIDPTTIPDFDVLCAGFPCQAFSSSGKRLGFQDTRGTLFFDICRVLEVKKPTAFILENVANLEKHDKGNTFKVMLNRLKELGYTVAYEVLNAKDFGVPQNRERVIIVGNKDGKLFDFSKVVRTPISSMKTFLDSAGPFEYLKPDDYTLLPNYRVQPRSKLAFCGYRNKAMRVNGVRLGSEHLSRAHRQPNRIYSVDGVHPTLSSQEQSGRYWIYDKNSVRKLTLNECFRFMGFPDDYIKIGAKSQLYARIGNSICVPKVQAVATEVRTQFFSAISK